METINYDGRLMENDIKSGEEGEMVFLKWAETKKFQIKDFRNDYVDFDFGIKRNEDKNWTLIDIKNNYDGKYIYLETHRTYPVENGWFYKSRSREFIMVNKKDNNEMIFLHNNKELHDFIERLLNDELYSTYLTGHPTKIILNDKTNTTTGRSWTSAFIKIPIEILPRTIFNIVTIHNEGYSKSKLLLDILEDEEL